MRLPSVVSLKSYVKPTRFPAFTRFNVFLRDRFTCQYCGEREDLTFDHVVPRSKGGDDDLGERRRRLLGLQSQEGRPAARDRAHVAGTPSPTSRPSTTCTRTAACSRPTICTKAGWIISTGTASWRNRPALLRIGSSRRPRMQPESEFTQRKSKRMKGKSLSFPFISFHKLFGIRTFQRLRPKKLKKISRAPTRAPGCGNF